jgi:hypothetical protein
MPDERRALSLMVRELANEATAAEANGTGDEFVMDLMERILNADTADAVFDAQESSMVSGKDFSSRPFVIASADDIEWRRSTQVNTDGGGFPLYAVMRVTEIATGDEVMLNCGGKTFVTVLYALIKRDYFNAALHPAGRSLVIVAVPSPAGAYLKLQPFKRPESRGKSGK